jgi:hypothetical protein
MALSWFKYNGAQFDGDPVINPLNFSLYGATPPTTLNGQFLGYVFATVQVINNVRRPIIPTTSPTGSVTISEIHNALTNQTSTPNVMVSTTNPGA